MGASFVIVLTKVIIRILVDSEYYEAWQYVPFLMLATVFTCFSSFLSSIYMVAKKNRVSMLTVLVGAVVNVALNLVLVPLYGGLGAASATFISCLLVFILRAVTTKRFIHFNMQVPKLVLNTIILLFQSVLMIMEVQYWIYLEVIFFILIVIINAGTLLNGLKSFISMRRGR